MIRPAKKQDCINLAALSLDVWLKTYAIDGIRAESSQYALSGFTKDYFEDVLKDSKSRLLVFVDNIYLRGYALVNLESVFETPENGFEIETLYVHGPFQGKGVGKALLMEIMARYGKRFWLYTWVHNKSIAFYNKLGFKDIGSYEFKLGDETIENRVLGYGRV